MLSVVARAILFSAHQESILGTRHAIPIIPSRVLLLSHHFLYKSVDQSYASVIGYLYGRLEMSGRNSVAGRLQDSEGWLDGGDWREKKLAISLSDKVDDRYPTCLRPASLARRNHCRQCKQTVGVALLIALIGNEGKSYRHAP